MGDGPMKNAWVWLVVVVLFVVPLLVDGCISGEQAYTLYTFEDCSAVVLSYGRVVATVESINDDPGDVLYGQDCPGWSK